MGLNVNMGRSRKYAAVDFDRRRLRVLAFTPTRHGPKFGQLSSVAIDEAVDVDSPESFGAFLARTLADMRLAGCSVTMTVPRGRVVLKPLSLPAGAPDGQLPGMVQYQIAKELPFAAEDAVVDFDLAPHARGPEGAGGEGVSVLAAAVRLPVVEFYRQTAQAAGVRLVRLGLRPYATGRCISRCVSSDDSECIVMVNVTADETEIDFFIGGVLAFSRAAAGGMPPRAVWPDERAPAVQKAVREVILSIQSFGADHPGRDIDAVLVSGDTGLEDDLRIALAERVEAQCELFHPARALGLSTRSDASAFAPALGAAICERPGQPVAFDFLAPKRPVVKRDTTQIKAAAVGAVILLVLIGVVGFGRAHLHALAAESKRLSDKVAAAKTKEKRVNRMMARVHSLQDWEKSRVEWLDHWAYLSSLFPSPTDAYVTDLSSRGRETLELTVRARSRDVIQALQNKLAAIEAYKVDTSRAPPSTTDPLELGYVYESKIELRVDLDAKVDLTGDPPARPADDGSSTLLPQRLRKTRGRSTAARGGRR